MTAAIRRLATLVLPVSCALALLAPAGRTQDGDGPERLEAWPELSKDERKSVANDVERLRAARTPEMADFAREGLLAMEAGAAPALLEGLGKEKDEAAQERLEAVLLELTDARHTRLLAAEFEHKAVAVRRFCLARAANFPDPGTLEPAEKALARLEKLAEKENARGYDEREHDAAAMAATAAGSHAGLERVYSITLSSWGSRGEALRAALEGARDAESTAFCAQRLEGADRRVTVALLNLLSGCGLEEDAVPLVRGFLDSEDNSIRVAAINALRGIVDGDPPISKLSVFDAIELAKEWQRRV